MKKFFSDVKSKVHSKDGNSQSPSSPLTYQPPPQSNPESLDHPPSQFDVYRYRYHHGTNIGSIFCLEKWLTGSMYPENAGSAELDAVNASIQQNGLDATREKFERHWRDYVSDADLDWLANDAHCTSIRLPIGYWTLGPQFTENTPFAGAGGVYTNSWSAVKDLINRCGSRGIGVLVDFHGLPGGANGNDHSGTNSGQAELWSNKAHQDQAIKGLGCLAREISSIDNIIGLQLCNEAEASSKDKGLWSFYDRAINEIRSINPDLPLYLSDAWDLSSSLTEVRKRNNASTSTNPLFLDTHLYYCFSPSDSSKSPQEIISSVPSSLKALSSVDVHSTGAAGAVVGEYSSVLSEETWSKAPDARDDLTREFGRAQSKTFQTSASGAFFWTYRMDWMDGGGWGFKQQTNEGGITAPEWMGWSAEEIRERIGRAREGADEGCRRATDGHRGYWDGKYPDGEFEHDLFEKGWKVGFEDAVGFFGMKSGSARVGGDKIGSVDMWVLKRLRESGLVGRKCVWEFEHGVKQGIKDFYGMVGV